MSNDAEMGGDEYMNRVRAMPCAALTIRSPLFWTRCNGAKQAHHAGPRPGIALKADDHTTIPLCMQHHTDWHAATGPFKNWDKAKRRAWSDEQIARTQRAILGAAKGTGE